MRFYSLLAVAGMIGLATAASSARAQDTASTVKKTGAAVHHTLKKTGNTIKQGAKDVGSAAHHALKAAGNKTKTAAGEVTGIHKVGGPVGQAAQSVSHAGKRVARTAKHNLKTSKASVHHTLKKTGDSTKATIKKPQ